MGWKHVCTVYGFLLKLERENVEESIGTYAIWIMSGLAMMTDSDRPLSERAQIADDLDRIIDSAQRDNPGCGYECDISRLHYKHPRRPENERFHLETALEASKLAVEQETENSVQILHA